MPSLSLFLSLPLAVCLPACSPPLVQDINDAGAFTHTYDAKSGTGLRITRVCVSDTRLLKFADAIDFVRAFDEKKIEVEEERRAGTAPTLPARCCVAFFF